MKIDRPSGFAYRICYPCTARRATNKKAELCSLCLKHEDFICLCDDLVEQCYLCYQISVFNQDDSAWIRIFGQLYKDEEEPCVILRISK